MMTYRFALVLSVALSLANLSLAANSQLVNKDVQRKVDLSASVAKISSEVTLENTGSSTVNSFIVAIEPTLAGNVASVVASVKSTESEGNLAVEPSNAEGLAPGAAAFKVTLDKALAAGRTVSVNLQTTFSHVLQPFPAEIKQAERQLVKYSGNLLFYSPYKTLSQKTVVSLPSSTVESYTKTKPVSKSDSSITYGPYENKERYSEEELLVHYENHSPFLAVTTMSRVIEVSHWGNIAVEETIDLRHTGAKLKGPFSRYDYQRQPSPLGSVKSFKTVLPASARDVYYRDEIGNISTSNMREMDDGVELELRPRFPLFGGWKTHYTIGYNIPIYQYLWTDGGSKFALKMPFVDHVFDNQVIDELEVKIVLPEGTKVTDLNVPFLYNRAEDERLATYLDTTGRLVVVLKKANLVQDHIQDFTLSYTFSKTSLFTEPFLIVGFFYFIFLFVIVYVRLDFSISKDVAAESKLKVSGYVENAQNVIDRRTALYQAYDDAVKKYKSSKDLAAYNAQKKDVESNHKELTNDLSAIQASLKEEGADAAYEKLGEIQKLDAAMKDSLAASSALADKLIAGKLNKDQYLSQEEQANRKREETLEKMEALANQL